MTGTNFTSWNGEQRTQWSAGDWSLLQRGDEIADITFAGTPVLRALRSMIRDRDWRTPEAQIRSVTMLEDTVSITASYILDDIDVSADLHVAVSDDQLTVSVNATAASAFWTQRMGLVAQQPPHLADADLTVVHPDGSRTATSFPNAVRPHQPAMDIAELRWLSGALPLRMRFDGGVFEMEDQRNWTDASYKTYTPPLAEPAPVQTTGRTWPSTTGSR